MNNLNDFANFGELHFFLGCAGGRQTEVCAPCAKGEDTKGFKNYIVPQSPSVKLGPVRTEPCIHKCRSCWSRDSENKPYTPWHNRTVFVAYPLHIRFISVASPWSTGTSNLPTVNHGKDTDMLRLCHGLYGCATVAPRLSTDTYGYCRLVTEKLKFFKQFENCLPERKSLRKHGGLSPRFTPDHYGHVCCLLVPNVLLQMDECSGKPCAVDRAS